MKLSFSLIVTLIRRDKGLQCPNLSTGELMEPELLATSLLGLAMAMSFAWALQRATGASGWVDTVWSFAVGIVGMAAALRPIDGIVSPRQWMVASLVGFWSLRLGGHIARRTMRGGDDPRYAVLAQEWGKNFPLRLFLFLQIQAVAGVILVLAVRLAATNKAAFPSYGDMAGVALLSVAIAGEAVADAQLDRFRLQYQGSLSVCETGLWRWSRHPNYFFEWLCWCAWPLIAIDLTGAHPWGWISLAAPALMYALLVHVSGIPPLERHMIATRGNDYRRLQARVNAFFPGPRRTSVTALKTTTRSKSR